MLKQLLYGKTVDFVALEGQILTVKTPHRLSSDPMKMRVRQEGREVGVRMLPLRARQVPGGDYVYSGLLMRSADLPQGMRAAAPEEQSYLRRSARLPWKAKVRCSEQLGWQGMSLDISRRGLQLETNHAVEPGQVLNLVLDRGIEDIPFRARVAWCETGAGERGNHRVGLELTGGSLDEVYERLVAARLPRPVLSRRTR